MKFLKSQKWTRVLLFSLTSLIIVGCAKERPIEVKPDPNRERLVKSVFTGSDNIKPLSGKKVPGTVWLAKTTITRTSESGGFAFVGMQSDLKAGYFDFAENDLRFYSAQSPYERGGADERDTSNDLINSWPITHSDIRLRESDGKVSNVEEEDPYKPWAEKRFFTVKWGSSTVKEAASFPYQTAIAEMFDCWMKVDSQVLPETIETNNDYITFTLRVDYAQVGLCSDEIRKHIKQMFTYTVDYTYSFKKLEESNYPVMAYRGESDPLMAKYGYFQTIVEGIDKGSGLYQNKILVNRWAPDKVHTIYFDEDYPQEYKWIFNHPKHGIMAKLNDLFERNGLGIRFKIEDANGKKFGDLRYSFIKIVDELDYGAPLGYGPSDGHPFTGEIIASNTVLWTGFLKYYLKLIETQIKNESNLSESHLYQEMGRALNQVDQSKWVDTAKGIDPSTLAGKAFYSILPSLTFGNPGWSRFTSRENPSSIRPFPGIMGEGKNTDVFAKIQNSGDKTFNLSNNLTAIEKLGSTNELDMIQFISKAKEEIKKSLYSDSNFHVRDTTVYGIESALENGAQMLLDGKTPNQVLETILYRVAIHEFGHNLGLRHNFYGSVDKKNFRPDTPVFDENGNPVMVEGPQGEPIQKTHKQQTSSVMEYLSLRDEMHLDFDWEPYDEAALVYAYSGTTQSKPVDIALKQNRQYLFCTDEHRPLNALCNTWDHGSTPTEIVMSLVEEYEQRFHTSNLRFGRPYWNTTGYASGIYGRFRQLKKFLLMWRTAFNETNIKEEISKSLNINKSDQINDVMIPIQKEMVQAVKLVVAFYNSVITQSNSYRPYRNEYEPFTGELKQVGIIWDKIFAGLLLFGDDAFMYNPNQQLSYASFFTYANYEGVGDYKNVVEKVAENLLTERQEMELWFSGFLRSLYAINAYNFVNMREMDHIQKIRVACYKPSSFKSVFGIDPVRYKDPKVLDAPYENLESALLDPEDLKQNQIKDPYFSLERGSSRIGVVNIDGNYFVAHETKNSISFNLMWNLIKGPKLFANTQIPAKDDILEMHRLYNLVVHKRVPECQ